MKDSTYNKVQRVAKEVSGKAKELAGKMTDNPNLRERDRAEEVEGKIQKKGGRVEKLFNRRPALRGVYLFTYSPRTPCLSCPVPYPQSDELQMDVG